MYQINILYNFSLYMLYVDSLSIFIINWAFPGGLVVRILGFHCHGLDLIPARPWVEILQVVQCSQKINKSSFIYKLHKSWGVFRKINKIEKPLIRLIMTKKHTNYQHCKWNADITAGSRDIKQVRKYYN